MTQLSNRYASHGQEEAMKKSIDYTYEREGVTPTHTMMQGCGRPVRFLMSSLNTILHAEHEGSIYIIYLGLHITVHLNSHHQTIISVR